MIRKYRAKYAASRSSSESSERFADSPSTCKLGSDALKYNAIGRYTVESKELDEDWFSYDHMTLNITKTDADGFVAFFSISGITGIMLLDTNEDDLYFRWLDKRYEDPDESASEDDGSQEVVEQKESRDTEPSSEKLDGENHEGQETHIKKEDFNSFNLRRNNKRERTSSPTPDTEVESKRQKLPTITTSTHDTLYFMWRGRASLEKEIQLDPQGDFIGHIKFLDAEYSHYEGVFYDTWTEQDLTLKGKKVSQDPGPPGESWAKLSWAVWEDEGGET